MLGFVLHNLEPVSWAESVIEPARAADLPQLPRLFTAASLCSFAGHPRRGFTYVHAFRQLEESEQYEPFEAQWSGYCEAAAYVHIGDISTAIDVFRRLIDKGGTPAVCGRCNLVLFLPLVGGVDEARQLAEMATADARADGNPFWIANALYAQARVLMPTDPTRAVTLLHELLLWSREHRVTFWEMRAEREIAAVEATTGDPTEALALFQDLIDDLHQRGISSSYAATMASLAVVLQHRGDLDTAALIYGASRVRGDNHGIVLGLSDALNQLRDGLDSDRFNALVAEGDALDTSQAIKRARLAIQRALDSNDG
jgi:tetratricopeptide (TPR) repeat protein